MAQRVLDRKGVPLDAHVDVEGTEFVFHSRGGKRGAPNARNLDYGAALRLLLERISARGHIIEGAWVDSDEARHLDRSQRSILDGDDLRSGPQQQFRVLSAHMQIFGRPRGAPYGGSRVKRICIRVGGVKAADRLANILELEGVNTLVSESASLVELGAGCQWEAITLVDTESNTADIAGDNQFDLMLEGRWVPAESVVALAVRLAARVKASQGTPPDALWSKRAYDILKQEGFEVVPVGTFPVSPDIPLSGEDREWCEGRPTLVVHLNRERAPGLARAKKRDVLRQFGRLTCERCGLDPVKAFGSEAAVACLEVHHNRLGIAEMGEGTQTTLKDVQLLCANCHRLVHALMKA